MFYTSDKLTNVFKCVMFVSQFHVHCKIGTLIYCITLLSISNANSCQMSAKNHSKAFACLLFFILNKGLFKDHVNKTRHIHQHYCYLLCSIIVIMAMERTKWEQIRKHLKNHEKEHSGHDENNFFFYSIFYLTTFFFVHFSLFLNNLHPAKTTKQPAIALVADAFRQPWVSLPNDV